MNDADRKRNETKREGCVKSENMGLLRENF